MILTWYFVCVYFNYTSQLCKKAKLSFPEIWKFSIYTRKFLFNLFFFTFTFRFDLNGEIRKTRTLQFYTIRNKKKVKQIPIHKIHQNTSKWWLKRWNKILNYALPIYKNQETYENYSPPHMSNLDLRIFNSQRLWESFSPGKIPKRKFTPTENSWNETFPRNRIQKRLWFPPLWLAKSIYLYKNYVPQSVKNHEIDMFGI